MAAQGKLSVELTEELAREIEAALASGDYATASDIVRDALLAWKRERADRGAALRRLRQLWDEGLASGDPVEGNFDAGDIKRRGRARLAARGQAAAE